MTPRLLEIRFEIDTHLRAIMDLRAEEALLITKRFRLPGPILDFDKDGRTIRWDQSEKKFGKKSFLFLKTLWNGGVKHRAKIEKIERVVFGIGGQRQMFLSANTLKMFLQRLEKELKKVAFPYSIKKIKNFSTLEIKGFQLVCTSKVQKNVPVQ